MLMILPFIFKHHFSAGVDGHCSFPKAIDIGDYKMPKNPATFAGPLSLNEGDLLALGIF